MPIPKNAYALFKDVQHLRIIIEYFIRLFNEY